MAINKQNYEAYFLDYIEGNLSAEDSKKLLLFLDQNLALKNELEDFEIVKLSPTQVNYENKKKLRPEYLELEDQIIASIESVNSEKEEHLLRQLLKKEKHAKALYNDFQKTILTKEVIEYPYKSSLKQKSRVSLFYYPLLTLAAAAIILFFMLDFSGSKRQYVAQKLKEFKYYKTKFPEEKKKTIKTTPSLTSKVTSKQKITLLEITKFNKIKSRPIQVERELALEIPHLAPLNIANLQQVEDTTAIKNLKSITTKQKKIEKESVTLNEWKNNLIRNKVLNQEEKNYKKIENKEFLTAVINGLNKVSNKEIAYENISSETTINRGFSIGNFKYSKTKKR